MLSNDPPPTHGMLDEIAALRRELHAATHESAGRGHDGGYEVELLRYEIERLRAELDRLRSDAPRGCGCTHHEWTQGCGGEAAAAPAPP